METNGSNNKLLLIDGHAMIYRAWFSIPERLSSKSGVDTRGVFGFLSTLFKTISNHNPTNIILTHTIYQHMTFRDIFVIFLLYFVTFLSHFRYTFQSLIS